MSDQALLTITSPNEPLVTVLPPLVPPTYTCLTITSPNEPLVTVVPPLVPPTYTLTALTQGPPGPAGAPGSAINSYTHTQTVSAAIWTVTHNLGFRPTVTIVTTGGVEIIGAEILHLSTNTLTLTFDVAFTGTARCN